MGDAASFDAELERWQEQLSRFLEEEHRLLAQLADVDELLAERESEQPRLGLAAWRETARRELRESKELVARLQVRVDAHRV